MFGWFRRRRESVALLSDDARRAMGAEYHEAVAFARTALRDFLSSGDSGDGVRAFNETLKSWPFPNNPSDATIIAFVAMRNAIVQKQMAVPARPVVAITAQLAQDLTNEAFRAQVQIVADEISRRTVRGDKYNPAAIAEFRSQFLVAFEPQAPDVGYVRARTLHPLAEALDVDGVRLNAGRFFPNAWVCPTGKYFKVEPECGSRKRATLRRPPQPDAAKN